MIVEAAARTAAEEGIYDSKEHVLKAVKQGAVTAYMEEISEQCGKTVKELFGRYREHTHALDDRIKLIDGAKETLEGLQKAGAAHFVYTHRGSSSGPILERLGILNCFREVVTSEYGLAWYVGDRTLDVYCAKDAGVKALLYLAPDTCVEATGKEDRIVKDLREI